MQSKSQQLSRTVVTSALLIGISFLLLASSAKNSDISYLLPDLLGWATLVVGLITILSITVADSQVSAAILTAFLFRAALAIVHAYVTPLPDSQADAATFEALGWLWSQNGLIGTLDYFTTGSYLYSWLISILYALTDRSPLMIQGINVLFGSLMVWNIYRISQLLWGYQVAVRTAWFSALFPSLALYSAITLREVAVAYPLTLAILYLVRWHRTKNTLHLFLFLISIAISISSHTGILAALGTLIALFLCRWTYSLFINKGSTFLRYTVILSIVLFFFGGIVMSGWGLEKIGSIDNISVDKIATTQQSRAKDRAVYLQNLSLDNPVDLVWQTPLRLVYFLYTPFVWMISTGADLAAQLDVLFYLGMTISLYRSRRYILSDPAACAVFLLLLSLITVFALSTSNYGTAMRHRAKFAPIAMSLTAVAPWERKLKGVWRG